MKKIGVLFLLTILLFSFVVAQNPNDLEENLERNLDKLEDTRENIEDFAESDKESYLKQEWTKILEKSSFGKFILGISNFLENFSPIFKIVLGMEYSLSWVFVFAVIIWIALFLLIVGPSEAMLSNKPLGIIFSVIVTSIIGLTGAIKESVNVLSIFINGPITFWAILLIIIFAAIIMKIIGKNLKKDIEKQKKEVEKSQEKLSRGIAKARADAFKKNK